MWKRGTQRLIAIVCLVLLAPRGEAASEETVRLNNEGVALLNANDLDGAIGKFTAALKLDPNYGLAKLNLSIASNNRGLKLAAHPKDALQEFHKALILNPDDERVKKNLHHIIQIMGLNPVRFEDRNKLAESEVDEGDFLGATIEFCEALKLRDDANVRRKFDAAFDKLDAIYRTADKQDLFPLAKMRGAAVNRLPTLKELRQAPGQFDADQYVRDVEMKVKHAWKPPVGHSARTVSVNFQIQKDGEVSNLRVQSASGMDQVDRSAMAAVEDAGPFEPLPAHAPKLLNIRFTFDYQASVLPKEDMRVLRPPSLAR